MIDADAVLLDLYDTVADGGWSDLGDIMLQRLGVERETLRRAFRQTRRERNVGRYGSIEGDVAAVMAACEIAPDAGVVAELAAVEREVLPRRARLYEDSLPVVRALRAAGLRTALISNCSHSTRLVVDALELEREFDEVVLSFEVGTAKPDPGIFRIAMERLGGVAPARSLFVDDQVAYLDGAATLGLATYLILRDGAEPAEGRTREAGGHPLIHDLGSLLTDRRGIAT